MGAGELGDADILTSDMMFVANWVASCSLDASKRVSPG